MHRACAARARGFDSLPSLSDVARLALSVQIKQKKSKVDFSSKAKSSNVHYQKYSIYTSAGRKRIGEFDEN
jgi:hypothetical protein